MILKNIFSIGLVALSTLACTAEFDEINTDPNRITEASNGAILTYVMRTSAQQYLGGGGLNDWVQYTGDVGAVNAFGNNEGNYASLYHDIQYQLDQIKLTNNDENGNSNRAYYIISEIMQCWTMANAVEMYGDMPYFNALQGGTYEGGIQIAYIEPEFDSQEEIYKDIILRLDSANSYLAKSETMSGIVNPNSYDIYAGGDMDLWRKFTNALRAKLYLRMKDADGVFAMAGLENLFADASTYPMFANYKEFMGIKWQGLGAKSENISGMAYSLYNNGDYDGRTPTPSTAMVRLFAETKDPRRFAFLTRPNAVYKTVIDRTFEPESGDSIKIGNQIYSGVDSTNIMTGFPPARHEDTDKNNLKTSFKWYSSLGGGFANVHRADYILDYAELCFIKAEAKLIGVNALSGSVEEYYEAGINANFDYYKRVYDEAISDDLLFEATTYGLETKEIFDADTISKFLNNPAVKLTGDATKDFEKIITQRFMANFNNGYNAFSIIRRTGLPVLDFYSIGLQGDLGYPSRFKYPEVVSQTNGDNLIKAIGKLKNTSWDGEVWLFENSTQPSSVTDTAIMDYILYDVFTCEQIYPVIE